MKNSPLDVFWDGVSRHKNITLDDIEEYPSLPWDFKSLSLNPNIDINFVQKHLNKTWDWSLLSINLPILDIEKHINLGENLLHAYRPRYL